MTASEPQTPDSAHQEPEPGSPEQLRRKGAENFMGPGFLEDVQKIRAKQRAYEFWYHPYTELAIFALIILSVLLLFFEISIPTGEPVGWLGGLAAGGIVGLFFWADALITLVFVVEYVSKLWITPRGRKWFFVRNSWIELLAILPVLRVFRLFRIFRAVRIFRVLRILRSVRLMRAGAILSNILEGLGSDLKQQQAGNFVIAAYFVAAMVFGTLGVLLFERGAGSGLDTIGDGLWWCIVTLSTVGYGDVVPETGPGRMVASVVVVMGLGLWSLVTGVVTSTLVQRARRNRSAGLDLLGIANHVVVLGWNDNGARLVHDFNNRFPMQHLVVVTDSDDFDVSFRARQHHLYDASTDPDAIDRAQIGRAQTVVVLAQRRGGDSDADVDARTVMLCMRVRRASPDIRIITELLQERSAPKARAAGADDVAVTANFTGALISQSVQSPGVNRAYRDLFDVDSGSTFAELELPSDYTGLSFSRAATRLFEDQRVSPVGIRRGDRLLLADDQLTVRPGDRGVVIRPVARSRQ